MVSGSESLTLIPAGRSWVWLTIIEFGQFVTSVIKVFSFTTLIVISAVLLLDPWTTVTTSPVTYPTPSLTIWKVAMPWPDAETVRIWISKPAPDPPSTGTLAATAYPWPAANKVAAIPVTPKEIVGAVPLAAGLNVITLLLDTAFIVSVWTTAPAIELGWYNSIVSYG